MEGNDRVADKYPFAVWGPNSSKIGRNHGKIAKRVLFLAFASAPLTKVLADASPRGKMPQKLGR